MEHEFAGGLSYPIYHAVRIGMETMGSYTEFEPGVGPTVAWSAGRFWVNIGVLFGMNSATADTQVRFLFGIPF